MNQETNGFPSGTGGVTTTSTATYPDGRKTFAAANNAGIAIIYGFGGTTAAAPNGGYRVQHVSSAIASAPVTLQVVLPLETSGDPISNPTGATNAINITGSLTKQTYFEDDIPEYAGVTVEGSYVGIRDSTDSAVANNSSYATLTGTPFTNGNEFFKEKYWTMNIARVRRPITLSRLYLDVTYNSTRTPGWNAPNNHQPNWEPGAYEGIAEKKMNSLLNGGDDATNKVASWQDRWSSTGAVGSAADAEGEPQPPAAGSVMNPAWGNQTAEIVDLDLMFRMPNKTPATAYEDLSDNYWVATTDATFDGIVIGDDNTASLPNSIKGTRRETTVRQAFLGLTAELPTVQLLPFGY